MLWGTENPSLGSACAGWMHSCGVHANTSRQVIASSPATGKENASVAQPKTEKWEQEQQNKAQQRICSTYPFLPSHTSLKPRSSPTMWTMLGLLPPCAAPPARSTRKETRPRREERHKGDIKMDFASCSCESNLFLSIFLPQSQKR